ncbi:MAG TPA: DDE-type integrase/transposase/recombinase [Acidimicrobiales bacterium]|nr:DDE-type integrase/transposase/recombinase [Acidimicrobiales bacterium]
MEDRYRDVALFRYSLIREAADPALSKAERGALVRALASLEHLTPDGRRIRVGRSTLDEWIRAWRAGGFEALVPQPRKVAPKIDSELFAAAVALKREAPGRSAEQIVRVMAEAGLCPPGVRSIQRHFARVGLNVRPDGSAPRAYGRFEASTPNELWTGDALHGPMVGGAKAYLLAFIDDYSRAVPGHRWCPAEDTLRLCAALRAGVSARGVPRAVLVDRGAAFVNVQFMRACASLGIRVIHASPRAAATKGKIERFFRTVRAGFLVELEARGGGADLAELNRLFSAWVEVVYHRRVHSETKERPIERFSRVGAPELPSPEALHEAFLWSEFRSVTKTATVSLHGNAFEVDVALVGRRVELVFDPFDLTDIEVRFEGRGMGRAVPVRIGRHVHPKARPDAAPEPVPTGIDYLGMVAARRAAELSRTRIDYAALSSAADPAVPTEEETP